jgi:OmpA-OmpF porin, OOP family
MSFRCYSRQMKAAALAISIGVVLGGCGEIDPSEQLAKDRLEQARTAYAQAKANPIVESYAMKSLLEAEKTLKEAEQIREKVYSPSPGDPKANDPGLRKLSLEDISRLAYMAERKSQISEALAEGVVTRNELVVLGKEKAEVELEKSQLEQKLLKKNLDEKASALEQAKQKLSQATSEAERAKIIADIQAKEAAFARAQAEANARDAEKAKAELAQLLKELSELQGQLTDRGIVLTIGDVLFASGKASLNASAQRSMDKLAEFLQKKQNRNLLVEGHTDSVGGDEYNQELSEHRAESVKNALLQRGVVSERIVTIGYGKKYPLASNATATGKQHNRRVEAIILNEGVKPETQFRK